MEWQDMVNGSFQFCAAPFIILSIIKLHKDKMVRGVSCLQVGFFTSLGMWNLYYFPHLNQWASFWGGFSVALADLIWLIQMIYYIKKEKEK